MGAVRVHLKLQQTIELLFITFYLILLQRITSFNSDSWSTEKYFKEVIFTSRKNIIYRISNVNNFFFLF